MSTSRQIEKIYLIEILLGESFLCLAENYIIVNMLLSLITLK